MTSEVGCRMKAGWGEGDCRRKNERRAIKAGGITDAGNLYTASTHTHARTHTSPFPASTLLKGPFEMWWLGEARGETLLSGELLKKH